ncbi:Nudix family hydrolase [Halopseudomonas nanhaiensis]|uniref:Nudix family hydrolase n=1 Tax=Halopseudomonas nanhaiensis TaxID=2830842 RepID=UPI001CBB2675|nr:Nudix family hydrolase [Halopseudomonas nanhaiensis]UAW99041.1 Nudix family hydrolase [Halopseudomonas nanhaiensis]
MRRVHVMAAVIRDPAGRILIARRPDHAHQGGLWEFPGGKLEPGEAREAGLARELHEELGITVTQARPLIDIHHDYPDKSIRLDVWTVDAFDGEAHGAEGQPIRWVRQEELDDYRFPQANAPIVSAARLPTRYLVTPDLADTDELYAGLRAAYAAGIRLVQLRQTQLDTEAYASLAEQVTEHFGSGFIWMLKGDHPPHQPGAGWHVTGRQLAELARTGWRREERLAWLAASCHDDRELALAAQIGVDFVTLSPVLPTRSHPGAAALGWERGAELIRGVNMPVYLLGGMSEAHLSQAFDVGAQGIAGISGLWAGGSDRS